MAELFFWIVSLLAIEDIRGTPLKAQKAQTTLLLKKYYLDFF